ncbi:LLM class flavin-dependent oxidoreductase [Streptomyces jumonjinensis]|uniref:LLM class flavin-dependent oxidoreductase n=1 Tax=Streptomyces jumonjinensis TaxID=1945 RepID=UPI0037B5F71D
MPLHDDVRFGVLLGSYRRRNQSVAEVFARTTALAACAEELEFDDLWVTEHHFLPTAVSPSALALAAYLLGRTHRIQVGTAVTLLPMHSPVHVAEQAALLDQLSGGRFTLGTGRGGPSAAYDVIGQGLEHWHRGLPEALDLIRAAWTGRVAASSDLHSFPQAIPTPAPLTPAGPHLYVAAGSPSTIETAAARGLPMLLFFDKTAEAKAEMAALHAKLAVAAGHPATGYRHAFALFAHVTDSPAHARDLMRARSRHLVESINQPAASPDRQTGQPVVEQVPEQKGEPDGVTAKAAVDEKTVDEIAGRLLATQAVGDAELCTERIVHHIRTSGCPRIMLQVEADSDHDAALRNLRRLAAEVLPAVRARLLPHDSASTVMDLS